MVRARGQHEVIDGELGAPAEQIVQRAAALGSFEGIGFVDPDPGELPALGAKLVERMEHGALLGEKRLAGLKPLFARSDGMVHGGLLRQAVSPRIMSLAFSAIMMVGAL